ncbi:unnamed protein product [Fraxinus pennsylvanica]|uniref:Uncharacterized protein n=1 Tax=Fraxinus pennsylvanica TaxID=56036 RepID=A0AAD2DYB6_9LAMI|nr:unnamed protein product [Fraxinus pennsylvanica]
MAMNGPIKSVLDSSSVEDSQPFLLCSSSSQLGLFLKIKEVVGLEALTKLQRKDEGVGREEPKLIELKIDLKINFFTVTLKSQNRRRQNPLPAVEPKESQAIEGVVEVVTDKIGPPQSGLLYETPTILSTTVHLQIASPARFLSNAVSPLAYPARFHSC